VIYGTFSAYIVKFQLLVKTSEGQKYSFVFQFLKKKVQLGLVGLVYDV